MIRAIIVDDEEQSRFGLQRFFDFSKYNIIISDTAANGKEALELIRAGHHQLVITDVRMPVMDGIALCEKLREEFGDAIQVLFISAYNELDYLHSAIRFGAVEYLTKPIDFDEFDRVMQRVSGKIAAWNTASAQTAPEHSKLSTQKQLIASALISSDWETLPEELGIAEDAVFAPILIRPEQRGEERTAASLKTICGELLRDVPSASVILLSTGDLCVLYPTDQTELMVAFSSKIQQQALSLLNTKIRIGIGKPVPLRKLSEAYKNLAQHFSQSLLAEGNELFLWTNSDDRNSSLAPDGNTLASLIGAFENLNDTQLRETLGHIFSKLENTPGITLESCRIYLLLIISHVINYLTEQGISLYSNPSDSMLLYQKMNTFESWPELKAFICSAMESFRGAVSARQAEQTTYIIRHIRKYISMHFPEAISVRDIANEVFLSVPYTCTLFKKETGVTIKDYLTQYRMKKAQEMLANPRYKLYQIGRAVGYSDPAYFTRQFRAFCGKTPSEYRKQMLKDDQKVVSKPERT